jgi:hypothetical protein
MTSIDQSRGLCSCSIMAFPLHISSFIKYMYILKVRFDVIKSISIKHIGFTALEGHIVVTYTDISK